MSEPGTATRASLGLAIGIAASFAFTALVWLLNAQLAHWQITPDRPGMYYEWQRVDPTFWSHATAWIGYALHQVTAWAILWRAQHAGLRYGAGLHRLNWIALGANAFFIVLHFVQTQLWYDGLAADVPEWTPQWSVILLLLFVILIENRRRGIAFGVPWGGFVREAGDVLRRWHGYYFAWAVIYTFWYHPVVSTPGHLLGFLYVFLLLVQGSLFYTRAHVNRWWTVTLEALVMVHGVTVALMNTDGMWHMFGFGLAGVFVVTQAWGLGLPRRACWALAAAFAAVVVAFYSSWGWADFPPVFRILGGYYVALPVLALLVVGLARAIIRMSHRTD